ncbi:MAG: hypothetical protein MPN21_12175 [Thermoanaerobaculia bacterium]|nr:hypothetical protein [Thermoanaerobaculia bacterium]
MTRRSRLVGTLLAVLSLLLFWATVVSVPENWTVGRAAAPWTDGAEYLDGAVLLARSGEHGIHVAGTTHPSRYPIGFSLIGAALIQLNVEPAWALHRANQLGGLALLLWTVAFWWRRIGPVAAGLAALLLASLPAFIILCRSPLSEIWGTTLAVAGIWWLYAWAGGGSRVQGARGVVLLAGSLWFRTSNLLLLVLFGIVAVIARHGSSWRDLTQADHKEKLVDLAWLSGAGILVLAPLWLQNWRTLGHPLTSGYEYWAPYWNWARAFDLKFVTPNLGYYARELVQSEVLFTTANLYGHGSYVGPAWALLTVGAVFGLRLSGRLVWFALAAGCYFATMTAYFFPDARLLFPLLVLAAPASSTGWLGLWRRARTRRQESRRRTMPRLVASLTTGLVAAAVLGWPAPGNTTFETLRFGAESPPGSSAAYRVTRQLDRIQDPGLRLVLTDAPPPYVHALMPPDTWVAPLTDEHLFRFNPEVFVFGVPERRQLVSKALGEGRSVWALMHAVDVRMVAEMSPPPEGYSWEIVTEDGPTEGGIARLVADGR